MQFNFQKQDKNLLSALAEKRVFGVRFVPSDTYNIEGYDIVRNKIGDNDVTYIDFRLSDGKAISLSSLVANKAFETIEGEPMKNTGNFYEVLDKVPNLRSVSVVVVAEALCHVLKGVGIEFEHTTAKVEGFGGKVGTKSFYSVNIQSDELSVISEKIAEVIAECEAAFSEALK